MPRVGTKNHYLQEYVDGRACAAVFMADSQDARLIGVTEQLVGETWLNAKPFHYCGSVGPIAISKSLRVGLETLGNQIVRATSVRGVFGVDCVLRDGELWPIEINPRYTASVEVLELALNISVLAMHRRVFEPAAEFVRPSLVVSASPVVGKAIVFARLPIRFPEEGPWLDALQPALEPFTVPVFADIPFPGETIAKGQPILTVFASGASVGATILRLKGRAEKLEKTLYGY